MANFDDQLNNISRRRAMADMLSKQGRGLQSQLGQTQYAGGYAIPTQGVESANAILSQLLGAYFDNKYAKEETETKEKQRQDMKEWAMMLNEVGKPSEIQPVTVGYGPSPERLSPEVMAGIDATNRGAQDIMVEDKQRQQNEVMSHLLSGLDKGGYAAQIAGTQLANQLSPMERKPVSGVPGVTLDSRGNFYDTSGNMLSSQQVQEIAQQMRKSSATSVTTNVGGATDVIELANKLAEMYNLTDEEAFARASAIASGQGVAQPSAPAQTPQVTQQTPAQPVAQEAAAEATDNPLVNNPQYVRGGALTAEGKKVAEEYRSLEQQNDLYSATQNSTQNLQAVEQIVDILAAGSAKVGPAFGSTPVFTVQKLLGEFGIGQANELDNALKRIQTAEKIVMIGQSGVRAFDTEKEMEALVSSIGDEKLTVDALLTSLDQIYDRSRRNLENARDVYGFLDYVGRRPSYSEFDPAFEVPLYGSVMDLYNEKVGNEAPEAAQPKPWERNWD